MCADSADTFVFLIPGTDAIVVAYGNAIHIKARIKESQRDTYTRKHMGEIHRGMSAH